eukprot:gene39273-62921_t
MAAQLTAEQQRVGERALQFLSDEKAFDGQRQALTKVATALPQATTAGQLAEHLTTLDTEAASLDLLSEQLGSLPGGDAVQRTTILDRIALLYADINRLRADARARRRNLGAAEQRAEFEQEMRAGGVDWRMDLHGGAVHSFTNPNAGRMGNPAVAYHELTATRSWRAMLDLFDE